MKNLYLKDVPKLRSTIVILDSPKLQSRTVILDSPKSWSPTDIGCPFKQYKKIWSKITVNNRNLGQSKITVHNCILDGPKLRSTTVILDDPILHSRSVIFYGPKVCLTGGPLDHRPNGRSKITFHRWSIGPLSK